MAETWGRFVGPAEDRVAASAKGIGVAAYEAAVSGEPVYVRDGKVRRLSGRMPSGLLALSELTCGVVDLINNSEVRVRR
ncbi:hypothetical protein [Streptomyces mirabilis]|uniref:hypothetical protein n=1 Tax=Streptomyces mirabilis TaxID=68239 RepID=UPI0036E2AE1F